MVVLLELIKDIESALLSNNIRCALGMALTLPDICGQIEFNTYNNRDRYVNWCNEYLFMQGYEPTYVVDKSKPRDEWQKNRKINGDLCYKLRCAYLHSGNLELNQRRSDNFPIFNLRISSEVENGVYTDIYQKDKNGDVRYLSMDARMLCRVLCNAAKEYYELHQPKTDFEDHYIKIDSDEVPLDVLCPNINQSETIQTIPYEQLSGKARYLFDLLCGGDRESYSKAIKNCDSETSKAISELIEGKYLNIPPNENLYGNFK